MVRATSVSGNTNQNTIGLCAPPVVRQFQVALDGLEPPCKSDAAGRVSDNTEYGVDATAGAAASTNDGNQS
jgi:hypothetical protein